MPMILLIFEINFLIILSEATIRKVYQLISLSLLILVHTSRLLRNLDTEARAVGVLQIVPDATMKQAGDGLPDAEVQADVANSAQLLGEHVDKTVLGLVVKIQARIGDAEPDKRARFLALQRDGALVGEARGIVEEVGQQLLQGFSIGLQLEVVGQCRLECRHDTLMTLVLGDIGQMVA